MKDAFMGKMEVASQLSNKDSLCGGPEEAGLGILHESICMKSSSYYKLRNA